ncbi:hypothetical protein [Vibrio cortegadensis]|uniref:hypothetical protein n=1 Tax=Vibrio cortegadensis TaxID=1328770 RepID=UPI0021C34D31|nr:hypothetical protein [Vibrio cortegadensis]
MWDWIGSGRLSIDGIKEVKESILLIESGLSTYQKELAKMGEDYIEVFEQQMREMKIREEKGLPRPSWLQAEQFAPEQPDEPANNGSKMNQIISQFNQCPVLLAPSQLSSFLWWF